MRLFVHRCENCGQKIYLDVVMASRSQLRQHFQGDYFYVTCNHCGFRNIFNVNQVFAEIEPGSPIKGGIIGGLLGLVAGPIGVLIGGGLGAMVGSNTEKEERNRVFFFNNSR